MLSDNNKIRIEILKYKIVDYLPQNSPIYPPIVPMSDSTPIARVCITCLNAPGIMTETENIDPLPS